MEERNLELINFRKKFKNTKESGYFIIWLQIVCEIRHPIVHQHANNISSIHRLFKLPNKMRGLERSWTWDDFQSQPTHSFVGSTSVSTHALLLTL